MAYDKPVRCVLVLPLRQGRRNNHRGLRGATQDTPLKSFPPVWVPGDIYLKDALDDLVAHQRW